MGPEVVIKIIAKKILRLNSLHKQTTLNNRSLNSLPRRIWGV